MEGVLRFLFALLLGVVLGVAGTGYLLQSGAGDFLIRRTDAVQDVERRLRDVETQRDQLGRQLEDVISRAGRMEAAFTELERRFRELDHEPEAKRAPGGE